MGFLDDLAKLQFMQPTGSAISAIRQADLEREVAEKSLPQVKGFFERYMKGGVIDPEALSLGAEQTLGSLVGSLPAGYENTSAFKAAQEQIRSAVTNSTTGKANSSALRLQGAQTTLATSQANKADVDAAAQARATEISSLPVPKSLSDTYAKFGGNTGATMGEANVLEKYNTELLNYKQGIETAMLHLGASQEQNMDNVRKFYNGFLVPAIGTANAEKLGAKGLEMAKNGNLSAIVSTIAKANGIKKDSDEYKALQDKVGAAYSGFGATLNTDVIRNEQFGQISKAELIQKLINGYADVQLTDPNAMPLPDFIRQSMGMMGYKMDANDESTMLRSIMDANRAKTPAGPTAPSGSPAPAPSERIPGLSMPKMNDDRVRKLKRKETLKGILKELGI